MVVAPTEVIVLRRSASPPAAQGGIGIASLAGLRVCLVYDCLFPWTVGGAERWFGRLAEELAEAGHEVTYLTRRQWEAGDEPRIPGVRVVAVSPGGSLYTEGGRRAVGPPLRFGLGVLRHLAGRRRRYDAVHLCAFPYFSLLAARLALAGARRTIVVDWFEVWTPAYWRVYLGAVGGRVGQLVQRLCVRLTPQAFVFSHLHARRLADEGLRRPAVELSGLYGGPLEPRASQGRREPVVVFAGRHIPEKRAHLVPGAVAAARERLPGLSGVILGNGPERPRVLEAATAAGGFVEAPGFVSPEEVTEALAGALCVLLPSEREGYGLVVVEAAALGTPTVTTAEPDNAAVELIEEGVNGFVAPSAEPGELAEQIVRAAEGGEGLRERTAGWFADNALRLSAAGSARTVADWYARRAA